MSESNLPQVDGVKAFALLFLGAALAALVVIVLNRVLTPVLGSVRGVLGQGVPAAGGGGIVQ